MKRQFSIGRILQYLILIIGAVVAVLPILVVLLALSNPIMNFCLPVSCRYQSHWTLVITKLRLSMVRC